MFNEYPLIPLPEYFQKLTIYQEDNRQQDGFYAMYPACENSHMFTIPSGGFIKINIVNTEPNTQDMSMRGWFSETPMGQMLFTLDDARLIPFNVPKMYSFDNINIPTPGLLVYIYDSNNPEYNDKVHRLDATKNYYINIQNIQNKRNSYRLLFSTDEYSVNYNDQRLNGSGFRCEDGNSKNICNLEYNDTNHSNCSCSCHKKSKGRPRKTVCPTCGCLPNSFIR